MFLKRFVQFRFNFIWIPISLMIFYLYYIRQLPITTSMKLKVPDFSNHTGGQFAVLTPGCQIPDFDPFHITVKKIIEKTTWLHCKDLYFPILNIENYTLIINKTVLNLHPELGQFTYCHFIPIYRDKEGLASDKYRYGNSVRFTENITVYEEFIKIECFSNVTLIYQSFHPFIIKKHLLEKKLQERFSKYQNLYKEQMNVLLVVLDSMSRMNFIRKFQQSHKFIMNTMGGIEYKGLNKVADSTFPCMIPLLTGKYIAELPWDQTMSKKPFDHYNIIWKNFSAHGYRTMLAEDPGTDLFPYFLAGFFKQPTDYYFKTMGKAIYDSQWKKKSNSNCLGPKLDMEFILDWLYDFVNVLRDEPHFSYIHISKIFHDYIEYFSNGDQPMFKFLTRLHTNNLLNNTVMFIFGDHGLRFGEIRNTIIGRLEERLPAFYVVFPRWFPQKYPKHFGNFQSNANKLTTPFDVYETLLDILEFSGILRPPVESSIRGISLFNEISNSRTCEDAQILEHWCTCHQRKEISVSNEMVVKSATFAVGKLNELLIQHKNICAILNISSISKASMSKSNNKLLQYSDTMNVDYKNERTFQFKNSTKPIIDYIISFTTDPSNATFESTIRYHEKEKIFELSGDISRTNIYGQQSHCVNNPILKKYCFCLDKV